MTTTVDHYVASDVRDLALLHSYLNVGWENGYSRRNGGYSLRIGAGGSDGWVKYHVPGASATKTIRLATWLHPDTHNTDTRFAFCEGSTEHLRMYFDVGTGRIKITNGAGTLLQDWTSGCLPSAWNLYEIQATLHDTTGSVAVKWQNTLLFTLTNKDTRNGGTPIIDNFMYYVGIGSFHSHYNYADDFTCADDWIGPGTLIVKVPTADGADGDWTASAGNKYDCVATIPPSTSAYIYADGATGGLLQSFQHGALASTPASIGFVSTLSKMRLSEPGSGTARVNLQSNGTYQNGDDVALGTTGQFVHTIAMVDPDTSAAWGKAGADAAQPGVETRV